MNAPSKNLTAKSAVPHYSNAPILEAVLLVSTVKEIPATAVSSMHAFVAETYPTKQQLFKPVDEEGPDGAITTVSKFAGFEFISEDGRHAVEARTDGLNVSRLRPYVTWENFSEEAKRVWGIYRNINTLPVDMIALRYINRLEIPLPVTDLRKYLRTLPEIAPELPHEIRSFLLRLELPSTDGVDIVLLEGTIKTAKPDVVALILDIEVKSSMQDPNDDEIWARFEILRARKNLAFEQCITDAVRELIK